jgi:hypothetical protein
MRRGRAFALVVVSAALLAMPWACGVDFVGDLSSPLPPDASDDSAPRSDGPGRDATVDGNDVDAVSDMDAGSDAIDSGTDANALCQPRCPTGTCIGGVCHVTCTNAAPCTGNPCPSNGVRCNVTCSSDGTGPGCPDSFNCTNCNIKCTGPQACNGNIACTGNGCRIQCCAGDQACNGNVSCTGAGCNVICAPDEACNATPLCNAGTCAGGLMCN